MYSTTWQLQTKGQDTQKQQKHTQQHNLQWRSSKTCLQHMEHQGSNQKVTMHLLLTLTNLLSLPSQRDSITTVSLTPEHTCTNGEAESFMKCVQQERADHPSSRTKQQHRYPRNVGRLSLHSTSSNRSNPLQSPHEQTSKNQARCTIQTTKRSN